MSEERSALSLFSGVGGLDLAWERVTRGRVVRFCEIDPWRRAVLRRHWPDVEIAKDVTDPSTTEGLDVDWIIGGFPCQAFSTAARGRNRAEKDLWPHMLRACRGCRPRGVFAENVSERAVTTAAEDLAFLGYACVVGTLSSADIGAPHDRRRWWLLADANPDGEPLVPIDAEVAGLPPHGFSWAADEAARILGVDDGLPSRMDGRRRAALGDAVSPPQAEAALVRLALEMYA